MSDPVRWGFLGAGWIAHRALAPAVHCADGAVLQAVAARDEGRARSLSPRGSVHPAYGDLLEDEDVDAVYLSLTNEAHLPWTLAALDAGKHVLCEKPMALSEDEVARMVTAAEDADRLLVEALWPRWHPRVRRAEALIATGAIGAVTSVDAGFSFSSVPPDSYRLDPARGGGALYDVGPYVVGAALWAVPTGAVSVVAADSVRASSGVDLTTTARLSVGDATATVHASIGEDYREWVRVTGREGSIEFSPPAHTAWLTASRLTRRRADGELVQEFPAVDGYQIMVEQLSRAIRGDRSAFVAGPGESLRLAAAMDAIRAAAA